MTGERKKISNLLLFVFLAIFSFEFNISVAEEKNIVSQMCRFVSDVTREIKFGCKRREKSNLNRISFSSSFVSISVGH